MKTPIIHSHTRSLETGSKIQADHSITLTDGRHFFFSSIKELANKIADEHPALALHLEELIACIVHGERNAKQCATQLEKTLIKALEVQP